MSQPYTWNEKHAEAAGLPVPTPADVGKVVTVGEDGSYVLSGGPEAEPETKQDTKPAKKTTARK